MNGQARTLRQFEGVWGGGLERGEWGWRGGGEVSSQSLSNKASWRGLQNVLWFTEEINIDFATRRSKSDFSNGTLHDLKHRSDDAENKH